MIKRLNIKLYNLLMSRGYTHLSVHNSYNLKYILSILTLSNLLSRLASDHFERATYYTVFFFTAD